MPSTAAAQARAYPKIMQRVRLPNRGPRSRDREKSNARRPVSSLSGNLGHRRLVELLDGSRREIARGLHDQSDRYDGNNWSAASRTIRGVLSHSSHSIKQTAGLLPARLLYASFSLKESDACRSVAGANPPQHAVAIAVHDPTAAHHAVAAIGIGAIIGAIAVGTAVISAPGRTSGETERKACAKAQANATPAPTAATPMAAMPAAAMPAAAVTAP